MLRRLAQQTAVARDGELGGRLSCGAGVPGPRSPGVVLTVPVGAAALSMTRPRSLRLNPPP
eukprot:12104038-Alexandrium_andersonii.AAC.1